MMLKEKKMNGDEIRGEILATIPPFTPMIMYSCDSGVFEVYSSSEEYNDWLPTGTTMGIVSGDDRVLLFGENSKYVVIVMETFLFEELCHIANSLKWELFEMFLGDTKISRELCMHDGSIHAWIEIIEKEGHAEQMCKEIYKRKVIKCKKN